LLFCADKETAANMAKETMVEAASVWVVKPYKPRPVQVLA
jgi:1,2-phenylacetyl-CoA epoxidase PaaB subunit